MRSTAFFLIACVFSSALATSIGTELQQLESTPFGKNLVETINLQLKSGDAIDRIQELLDNIAKQIEQEQAAADKAFEAKKAYCDETRSNLEGDIKDAQDLQYKAEYTIKVSEPKLEQAKKDLTKTIAEIEDLTQKLADAKNLREQQKSEWEDADAEHEKGLELLSKLRTQFTLLKKQSFLQKGQISLAQVSHTLNMGITEINLKKFNPIFQLFASMMSREIYANQELVEKILGLIEQIKNNLTTSQAELLGIEQKRIVAYQKKKQEMEADKIQAEGEKVSLTNTISSLEGTITDAKTVMTVQSARQAKKEKELEAHNAGCDAYYDQYNTETQTRTFESGIVKQAKVIVASKLATMSDYLRSKVN